MQNHVLLQMLLSCCNVAANKAACQSLMAIYPGLQDADLNTNPNYCYFPNNLCSLYAICSSPVDIVSCTERAMWFAGLIINGSLSDLCRVINPKEGAKETIKGSHSYGKSNTKLLTAGTAT